MGQHAHDSRTNLPTIQRLLPHHRAIARARAFGVRPTEIALRFGLTESWVSEILNSPLMQAEIERLQRKCDEGAFDVARELDSMIPQAINVLGEDLFQPERSKQRTNVAVEVLGMRGWSKQREPQQSGDTFNIINFSPNPGEDPDAAKARLATVRDKILDQRKQAEALRDELLGGPYEIGESQ